VYDHAGDFNALFLVWNRMTVLKRLSSGWSNQENFRNIRSLYYNWFGLTWSNTPRGLIPVCGMTWRLPGEQLEAFDE